MERYYCRSASCQKWVDSKICPDCGSITFAGPANGGTTRPEEPPAPPRPATAAPPVEPREAPRVERPAPAAPRPQPESEGTAEQADQELQSLVAGGAGIYLTAGIASTGKTQLLGASTRVSYLVREGRRDGRALPTPVGITKKYSYESPGKVTIFLDASGERFRLLYPSQRHANLRTSDLAFLRTVVKNLRGLVLLLDLDSLWSPQTPAGAEQEKILRWIIRLFRFLHFGGTPRSEIDFTTHVESTIDQMPPGSYLPFPVQLIFSKADLLLRRAAQGSTANPRWPDPRSRSALKYALRMFPDLLRELRLHVRHFRVDFAQAVGEDPITGKVTHEDWDILGVDAALDWLVNNDWRGRGPSISTDRWLKLQELWDDKLLRRNRWGRQPVLSGGGR